MQILTVTTADVGDTITTNNILIKSIRVHGLAGSVAGSLFRLDHPTNGTLRFRTEAAGAWYVEESITQRIWLGGFKVTTLDAGEIDIEYDNMRETTY